jgi:hypothetical protein
MVGAIVQYCGHRGVFVADVLQVAGAVVVRANRDVERILLRNDEDAYARADFHLSDSPGPVFWRPRDGFFVVPTGNLTRVRKP